MDNISTLIDKVAQSLEDKGLIREARQLDVVANTLDKYAGSNTNIKVLEDVLEENGLSDYIKDNGGVLKNVASEQELLELIGSNDLYVIELLKANEENDKSNVVSYFTPKIVNAFINRGDRQDLAIIAYMAQDYGVDEILPKNNYLSEQLSRLFFKGKDHDEALKEIKKKVNEDDKARKLIHGTDKLLGPEVIGSVKP